MKLIIDSLIDPLMYLISYRWDIGLDSCVKCPPIKSQQPNFANPTGVHPRFFVWRSTDGCNFCTFGLASICFWPCRCPAMCSAYTLALHGGFSALLA